MRKLIKGGANMNVKNNEGNAPLHIAARNTFSFPDGVKELLLRSANPRLRNNEGNTPLHILASIGIYRRSSCCAFKSWC